MAVFGDAAQHMATRSIVGLLLAIAGVIAGLSSHCESQTSSQTLGDLRAGTSAISSSWDCTSVVGTHETGAVQIPDPEFANSGFVDFIAMFFTLALLGDADSPGESQILMSEKLALAGAVLGLLITSGWLAVRGAIGPTRMESADQPPASQNED